MQTTILFVQINGPRTLIKPTAYTGFHWLLWFHYRVIEECPVPEPFVIGTYFFTNKQLPRRPVVIPTPSWIPKLEVLLYSPKLTPELNQTAKEYTNNYIEVYGENTDQYPHHTWNLMRLWEMGSIKREARVP